MFKKNIDFKNFLIKKNNKNIKKIFEAIKEENENETKDNNENE